MEISNEVILKLVEDSAANRADLNGIAINLQSMRDQIDRLTENQREIHKKLGSKASLEQWLDIDKRLKIIESSIITRTKISEAFTKAAKITWLTCKSLAITVVFIVTICYSVEKREALLNFLSKL